MEFEGDLYLEPSDCIFIAHSVDEIAAQVTSFDSCEVCEKYKKWGAPSEKREQHVKSFHCNLAVSRPLKDGRTRCMLRGGANGKRSHYHCPFCGRMCGRRNNMLHHFKINCTELKWKGLQRQLPKSVHIDSKSDLDTSTAESSDGVPVQQQTDYVVSIMETRLSDWIKEQRLFGKTVNLVTMLEKARFLHEKTKHDLGLKRTRAFYGGKQWVKSFLERFGMKDTTVLSLDSTDNIKPPEKDIIVKLIEKVSEKQTLYDPLVAALGDQNDEDETEIWDEIARSVGLGSGIVAKQIWCDLERKYHERNKPGASQFDSWEYEHFLKFLPTEIILEGTEITDESGIGGVETVHASDVTTTADGRRLVTVSIQDDSVYELHDDDEYGNLTASNRLVNIAKLRKIHLQMEAMQQEHALKMEMMNIEKKILLKKLDSI